MKVVERMVLWKRSFTDTKMMSVLLLLCSETLTRERFSNIFHMKQLPYFGIDSEATPIFQVDSSQEFDV